MILQLVLISIVSVLNGASSTPLFAQNYPMSLDFNQIKRPNIKLIENQQQKYLFGRIGCTFTTSVCEPDLEYCFNDHAFGKCLPTFTSPKEGGFDLYKFKLSKKDVENLEIEMERLFKNGFRWVNSFTQCKLQSLLTSIKNRDEENVSGEECIPAFDDDLNESLNLDGVENLNNLGGGGSNNEDDDEIAFIKFAPEELGDLKERDEWAHEDFGPGKEKDPLKFLQKTSKINPIALSEKEMKDLLDNYLSQNEKSEKWGEAPVKKSKILVKNSGLNKLIQRKLNEPETRIFSKNYNTPEAFRHGLNSNEELEFLEGSVSNPDALQPQIIPEQELSDAQIKELIGLIEEIEENSQLQPAPLNLQDSNEENQPIYPNYLNPQNLNNHENYPIPQNFKNKENSLTPQNHEYFKDPQNHENYQNFENPQNYQNDENQGDDEEEIFLNLPEGESIFTEGGYYSLPNYPKRIYFESSRPEEMEEIVEALNGVGAPSFERRERLDVKKPGPWYRTVNNFAFEKGRSSEENENVRDLRDFNPEFNSIGPADMDLTKTEDLNKKEVESLGETKEKSGEGAKSSETQGEEVNKLVNLIKKASSSSEASKLLRKGSESVQNQLEIIDTSYVTISTASRIGTWTVAHELVTLIADLLDLSRSTFQELRFQDNAISFKVDSNGKGIKASQIPKLLEKIKPEVRKELGIEIIGAKSAEIGVGVMELNTPLYRRDIFKINRNDAPMQHALIAESAEVSNRNLYIATFTVCGIVGAAIISAFIIIIIRKNVKSREKFSKLAQDDPDTRKDYEDLCRARVASKTNEKNVESIRGVTQRNVSKESEGTSSSRSSTSSWNEEPVLTNMDISTGHMVLSYMEDHLKKKDRLDQEWAALCNYEADPGSTSIAEKADNMKKNRYSNSLPYDHSRVILNDLANVGGADYINASTITDHDPRNPAYICTQGPLGSTSADFWQMVWEQGSVVIVNLTKLVEGSGPELCVSYWPGEGSELHHIYEVHLVSEHIWCEDYLVRSFYLKNLKTGETRTVTQFHYLAWPENGIPTSAKSLLEFRRKVNKSYRGRSCPIIVHCSDGSGRSGTYCLIDMVLNRMGKGAKEIDIAASLEHIRDQRPGMVRTKQQFEFVLMAVAEEVHAILKALPQ